MSFSFASFEIAAGGLRLRLNSTGLIMAFDMGAPVASIIGTTSGEVRFNVTKRDLRAWRRLRCRLNPPPRSFKSKRRRRE